MKEEEIIKYIKEEIENETDTFHWFDDMPNNNTRKQIEESIKAHQGLLDLYEKEKMNSSNLSEQLNKEKEKNSKAIGHIESCKTSLGNYILSPNETEYLLEILQGGITNE